MRVAIAGGHGQIARHLARTLGARGDAARAIIRNPAHAADLRALGAEPHLCDLESASEHELDAALRGADALVFAAGAGPGSGAARKLTVDRDAAVALRRACERVGVRRYVMISAIGAADPPDGDEVYAVYLRAKAEADRDLVESGLDWTVVRPGELTDEPGTGRVLLGERVARAPIPRQDAAAVVLAALGSPSAIGRVVNVVAGDTPVERAFDPG